MKKIAGIILSLCVLLSAFSVNVFAADEATTEDPHKETREYTEAFNKQLSKGDVTGIPTGDRYRLHHHQRRKDPRHLGQGI